MQILGTAAIVAALGGFALFLSTVTAAHGVSGAALALGVAALFMTVPVTRSRARRGTGLAEDAGAAAPTMTESISAGVSLQAARGWTLGVIFAVLALGMFTLRYMYWL